MHKRHVVTVIAVSLLLLSSCGLEDGQGDGRSKGSDSKSSDSKGSDTDEAATISVPKVVGETEKEAVRALESAGLVTKIVDEPSSKGVGTVLEQAPAAGDKVSRGEEITLVVAVPLPMVPKLVGLQLSTAVKKTKEAGYKVKTKKQNTTTEKNGLVLSQTPSPGTKAKSGATVTIVYANNICTPGYSPCLPIAYDYDCAGGDGDGPKYVSGTVKVTGTDIYELDSDGDGIGCN